MIILDTNVLVYALNADAPQHEESRTVIDAAFARQIPAVLVPQVLVEAYAILTDRRRVERPLVPDVAWTEIQTLRLGLPVFELSTKAFDALAEVITSSGPVAQDIFDALLVAQMRAHGMDTLCTYNTEDFRRYAGIRAEEPRALLKRFGISTPEVRRGTSPP